MVLSGAFAQRTPYGYRREAGSLLQQDLTEPNARALELAELCEKLHADLLGPAGTDSARAAALADSLIELNGLSDRLRRHVTALRFDSLERIHEGLARLRSQPSIAELMPQTAEELARCCGFDRAVVSSVRGSSWRAEAAWIAPNHDLVLSARIEDYVTGKWIPLAGGVPETALVRRRVAVLARAEENRADDNLMGISRGSSYVAAPVIANRRVVRFLQADCLRPGRELTALDTRPHCSLGP